MVYNNVRKIILQLRIHALKHLNNYALAYLRDHHAIIFIVIFLL